MMLAREKAFLHTNKHAPFLNLQICAIKHKFVVSQPNSRLLLAVVFVLLEVVRYNKIRKIIYVWLMPQTKIPDLVCGLCTEMFRQGDHSDKKKFK